MKTKSRKHSSQPQGTPYKSDEAITQLMDEVDALGELHAKCERAMRKRDYIRVRNWPPSVHEEFTRGIHPRGYHYDPADDGPEVELINKAAGRAAFEFFEESEPGSTVTIGDNTWLNVGPSWPADAPVDTLKHRRE